MSFSACCYYHYFAHELATITVFVRSALLGKTRCAMMIQFQPLPFPYTPAALTVSARVGLQFFRHGVIEVADQNRAKVVLGAISQSLPHGYSAASATFDERVVDFYTLTKVLLTIHQLKSLFPCSLIHQLLPPCTAFQSSIFTKYPYASIESLFQRILLSVHVKRYTKNFHADRLKKSNDHEALIL